VKPFQPKMKLRLISNLLNLVWLVFCASALYVVLPQATKEQTKPRKQLSESAKKRILERLTREDRNSISVFNLEGQFQKNVRVIEGEELPRYASLEDFVVKNNPVDTCKNPVPAPPPPCVICDDGTVLCSKAKFMGEGKKQKQLP
jgi:hypothetical protein